MQRQSKPPTKPTDRGGNRPGVEQVEVSALIKHTKGPREHSEQQIDRAVQFVRRYHDNVLPIIVTTSNVILVGGLFVEAARRAGIRELRVIRQDALDEHEELLFSIAAERLLEQGSWNANLMEAAVRELESKVTDFSSQLIGFAPGELDKLIGAAVPSSGEDDLPAPGQAPVSRIGSLWLAGDHRILCGDATDSATLHVLMNDRLAAATIADPPFGCAINGFVAKRGKHRAFVEVSGEKTDDELSVFFDRVCEALHTVMAPGALTYLFIDWRSMPLLHRAGERRFGKLINLCVWSKDRAGMGSFYRSQHELVLVFRKPGAQHRNNVALGRYGRNRSNIWAYPCAASSRRGREADMLRQHPTLKSVEMIADAIMDCTARGDIVLDTFLGSGTTLIAAHRTGRLCFGTDLDPLYVDLAVRRWQDWTGTAAIDAETGRTFDELAASRREGGDE